MEKAVNPYSAFAISTAGEPFNTSSSEMKKSRRLTMEQTRALEKSFELAKILEDGRKEELAETLGLNPRQICIWFQNRRTKWKTAQLEKNFGVLKESYESLKGHYHTLLEENRKLQSEIQRSCSMLKNIENRKDKEVTGDRRIDFNIVQDKKEGCYGVHNTEDNIPHQASMEENCSQNLLWAFQEEDCHYNFDEISGIMSAFQEEDCPYNFDEISGIMSVRSLDYEFLLE
eukprot:PITA_30296